MQPQYVFGYHVPNQRHDCQTLLQQLTSLPAQDSLVHNGTAAVPSQCCMIDLAPIATHPTDWRLASPPTLNIALDGCIVPCGDGARVDYAHVVVLDDFIDEPIRKQLMDFLTAPGWQVGSAATVVVRCTPLAYAACPKKPSAPLQPISGHSAPLTPHIRHHPALPCPRRPTRPPPAGAGTLPTTPQLHAPGGCGMLCWKPLLQQTAAQAPCGPR